MSSELLDQGVNPDRIRLVRAIGMRAGDLLRDPRDGMMSLVKTISVASWLVVTFVTIWEAVYRSVSAADLFWYSITSQVCAGGPMAATIISMAQPRLAGLTGKYGIGKDPNTGSGSDGTTTTTTTVTAPADPPPKP